MRPLRLRHGVPRAAASTPTARPMERVPGVPGSHAWRVRPPRTSHGGCACGPWVPCLARAPSPQAGLQRPAFREAFNLPSPRQLQVRRGQGCVLRLQYYDFYDITIYCEYGITIVTITARWLPAACLHRKVRQTAVGQVGGAGERARPASLVTVGGSVPTITTNRPGGGNRASRRHKSHPRTNASTPAAVAQQSHPSAPTCNSTGVPGQAVWGAAGGGGRQPFPFLQGIRGIGAAPAAAQAGGLLAGWGLAPGALARCPVEPPSRRKWLRAHQLGAPPERPGVISLPPSVLLTCAQEGALARCPVEPPSRCRWLRAHKLGAPPERPGVMSPPLSRCFAHSM